MNGDSTRAPRAREEDVKSFHDYLLIHAHGRANAKTANEIADALELGPHADRLLRALKHAANESDLLICADNAGYFIPASRAEADESIGRVRSQGLEMIEIARQLERLADQRFTWDAEQLPLLSRPSNSSHLLL